MARLRLQVEKDIEDDMIKSGRLNDPEEDIHSVVERRLFKYAGDAALRLHTARSRNDQSATDTRLWMLVNLPKLHATLKELITVYYLLTDSKTPKTMLVILDVINFIDQ